jgi:WD40 repeat protein
MNVMSSRQGLTGPRRVCLVLMLVTWLTPSAGSQDRPVSFMQDIAPILKESCLACHDAKKKSGKLDMSTFERLAAGGNSDSPFVAGKPDESLLMEVLTATGKKRMPPEGKGQPLTKHQIELVSKWIEQGAKLDAGVDPKADLVREVRKRWQPPSILETYRYPVNVTALSFSPDGKQIVVGGHHELLVWDINGLRLVKRIRTRSERSYSLLFSRDGLLIVAGGRPGQEGDVRVYNPNAPGTDVKGVSLLDGVQDPKVLVRHLLDTDDSILSLAISRDGTKLAAAGCDRVIRVWDVAKGWADAKIEQTIENHADWVLSLAFAPDGSHLLSSSRDKTAKVWDLKAKESVMTFPDHQQPVYGVVGSHDGKLGYSAGEDKQIRIWRAAAEGKQIRALGGHGDAILRLAIHPQQAMIATASADRTVRLWNPDNGTAGHVLSGLSDEAFALGFSPDGTRIAAGSYLGEVAIWNVADGKLLAKWNVSPGLTAAR